MHQALITYVAAKKLKARISAEMKQAILSIEEVIDGRQPIASFEQMLAQNRSQITRGACYKYSRTHAFSVLLSNLNYARWRELIELLILTNLLHFVIVFISDLCVTVVHTIRIGQEMS